MNARRLGSLLLGGLILALLVGGLAARAAPEALSLDWWTVDGGGGSSHGGAYTLSGTIGQPEAGTASGGGYTLAGGFWGRLIGQLWKALFLPLIHK